MKKNIDTYIGIFLIAVAALNILNILGYIGITQKFVDIVLLITGIYLAFIK